MFPNSQRQWLILIAISLVFCLMLITLGIENLPSISAQGGATPNEATYQAATLQKLIEQERGTSIAQQTASAAAQTGPSLAELQQTARAALTLTAQSVPAISLMPATTITEKNKVGIRSVAFSPTAPVLAYGSQGGQIYLWNLATGADAATLEGHSGPVNSLAFSPDGRTLASGGADGTVRLWNMATGAPIASLQKHSGSVNSVAFKPDGTLLASAGDDATVRLWDVQIRQELAALQGHKGLVHTIAFSPDGNMLASAGIDGGVILWDVGSRNQQALLAQGSEIFSVAFSPDKTALATGSGEGIVQLWNLTDRKELRRFEIGPSLVVGLAFSTDGSHLAAAIDSLVEKTIKVWDVRTGKEQATLRDHPATIRSIAFSRDGRLMASGSDDGTARLWDVTTGSQAVNAQSGRKVTISANRGIPLFSKPENRVANMVANLIKGEEITLLGRTSDSKWIQVIYKGQRAWLEAETGAVPDGDIASLPIVSP